MEVKIGLVYISRFVLKYLGMQYCGPAHILHVGPPCTYTMRTMFSHLQLLLVSCTRIKRWMSWLLTGDGPQTTAHRMATAYEWAAER